MFYFNISDEWNSPSIIIAIAVVISVFVSAFFFLPPSQKFFIVSQ